MSETTKVALGMVIWTVADPRAEAAFWSELLGWEIAAVEDEYAMLKGPDRACSASARCPTTATDLAERARQQAVPLRSQGRRHRGRRNSAAWISGRPSPTTSPGETWRVLLDPAGTRSA